LWKGSCRPKIERGKENENKSIKPNQKPNPEKSGAEKNV
jgi:hypothetical protein